MDQGATTGKSERQKAAQDSVQAAQAELSKALEEFNTVRGQAKVKGGAAAALDQAAKVTPNLEGLAAAPQAIAAAARTTEVKGTFNAAAIRGLNQGDSVVDAVKEGNKIAGRQLDEQLKTRRTIEEQTRLQ